MYMHTHIHTHTQYIYNPASAHPPPFLLTTTFAWLPWAFTWGRLGSWFSLLIQYNPPLCSSQWDQLKSASYSNSTMAKIHTWYDGPQSAPWLSDHFWSLSILPLLQPHRHLVLPTQLFAPGLFPPLNALNPDLCSISSLFLRWSFLNTQGNLEAAAHPALMLRAQMGVDGGQKRFVACVPL